MKIGIVFSCFDLLHPGHCLLLKEAKQHCDFLIACLQTDPSIERKEKNSPVQSLFERWVQLDSSKYVDQIIPYTYESEVEEILKARMPDIRFLGDDYIGKRFTGDWLEGIEIRYCNRDHGFSSSSLREKIKNG